MRLCIVLVSTFLLVIYNVNAQFAGGNGSESNPYQIENPEQLNRIRNELDAHYVLTSDIDLSKATGDSIGAFWNNGKGWEPIGNVNSPFSGLLNGNGYKIVGLTINRTMGGDLGLFSKIQTGVVRDLDLDSVDITGRERGSIGGLAGGVDSVKVENVFVNGDIEGGLMTGGLVGSVDNGSGDTSLIIKSGGAVDVTGYPRGDAGAGGLVGYNDGEILQCYATGDVSGEGQGFYGGLVGSNRNNIANSYVTGNVSGSYSSAGLAGSHAYGEIRNCYATGKVSGQRTGGLIEHGADAQYSYWDSLNTNQTTSAGGEGRTTDEMTLPDTVNTYIDWGFDSIWAIDSCYNNGYPYLQWQDPENVCNDDSTVTSIRHQRPTDFTIYPNPANQFLKIEGDLPDEGVVEIINQTGRIVIRLSVPLAASRLNLNGLSEGLYFVLLKNKEDSVMERLKLLKN